FFQAEDGIRDFHVTGVQTCALPISRSSLSRTAGSSNAERTRSCSLSAAGIAPSTTCRCVRAAIARRRRRHNDGAQRAGRRGAERSEERRVGKEGRWWGRADEWRKDK